MTLPSHQLCILEAWLERVRLGQLSLEAYARKVAALCLDDPASKEKA